MYGSHLTSHPPESPPDRDVYLRTLRGIAGNPDYHILLGECAGRAVSSVTLVIVRNLTHGCLPYALIENVVTHADFRGRGYASTLMAKAVALATEAGCYKVMLMTGSKLRETLAFYERCGFNRQDKTGFIQWIP